MKQNPLKHLCYEKVHDNNTLDSFDPGFFRLCNKFKEQMEAWDISNYSSSTTVFPLRNLAENDDNCLYHA